ncbi:MAG: recombinase family protein [Peptococcaceae bacterium]|nr:recombinase family protein [Peptococcaceae bacterium]
MIYGYMRVSTTGQVKGNSLEEQERVLRHHGAQEIYQDAFTGTKTSRPNFNILMEKLTDGDTLIVTKLDRFARNTVEGINVIQKLLDKGVRVTILNMGTVDNTPTGKLILTVMLGFAEFERDMIMQRTSAGKAIAKTKEGYSEGRPQKYTEEEIAEAMDLLNKYSFRQVSKMTKISKSTLLRLTKRICDEAQ